VNAAGVSTSHDSDDQAADVAPSNPAMYTVRVSTPKRSLCHNRGTWCVSQVLAQSHYTFLHSIPPAPTPNSLRRWAWATCRLLLGLLLPSRGNAGTPRSLASTAGLIPADESVVLLLLALHVADSRLLPRPIGAPERRTSVLRSLL
jgi:hypothetical protein